MTATLDTAAPYAPPDGCTPFLATIAATHLAELLAPCATCKGSRTWSPLASESCSVRPMEDCPDCDKPRRHDMGPRLVFADYLEEQGDPWGEFIRIGVEMANHRPEKIGWSFLADGTSSDAESRAINDENPVRERLQRRHAELLARHGAAWARVVLKDVFAMMQPNVDNGYGGYAFTRTGGMKWDWHGGLPADFTLSLDAWMGRMCGGCGGNGNSAAFKDPGEGQNACHQCRGTGRVNALGPLLLAAAPVRVEGLRFSGKRPESHGWRVRNTTTWTWWRDDTNWREHTDLPAEVFNLLEGDIPELRSDIRRSYSDLAAAHDALARAAIAWAGGNGVQR